MSPNCRQCDDGAHDACTGGFCECGKRGHIDPQDSSTWPKPSAQETDQGIPNYAILDLWMALGNEPNHDFDDAIAVRGKADVWAYLLSAVRALNDRGFEERVAAVKETQAENGDPLYLRAKAAVESLRTITCVNIDVARSLDGTNNLEATVTIVGPVS